MTVESGVDEETCGSAQQACSNDVSVEVVSIPSELPDKRVCKVCSRVVAMQDDCFCSRCKNHSMTHLSS